LSLSPPVDFDRYTLLGMGCVFKQAEPYSLLSEHGAIILIVEAEELVPHPRGISTPERIAGAGWPSDAVST
jgi:hypothetical protein